MNAFFSSLTILCFIVGSSFGNSPNAPQVITPDSAPVEGVIEYDTNHNWYAFTATPEITYQITVTTNTIWDNTVRLVAPDKITTLAQAVTSNAAAYIEWNHTGAAAQMYLDISGFLDFTTGRYDIVITRTNYVDADADGMPDSWELARFATTTNLASGDWDRDSFSNLQEYWIGSDPTNASSGLRITAIEHTNNLIAVKWDGFAYGTYRLSKNPHGASQNWPHVYRHLQPGTNSPVTYLDANSSDTGHRYRVELIVGE